MYQTLKVAKTKFDGSKEALEQINDNWSKKEMLVPLTGMWRVSSIILINSSLTNYQDITTSKDYSKRKVNHVQEQMDKIDTLGRQKSKVLNAVIDVIEMEVAALQAAQQQ